LIKHIAVWAPGTAVAPGRERSVECAAIATGVNMHMRVWCTRINVRPQIGQVP